MADPKHSRTSVGVSITNSSKPGYNSITIGGAADHVHVLCNLTKKLPTAKVVEILKKDSSKFIKTLGVPDFHWQDGYGLFRRSEGVALGYDGSGRWPAFGNRFTLL